MNAIFALMAISLSLITGGQAFGIQAALHAVSSSSSCYDAGYEDGRDNPFNHDTYDHCADSGEDDEYYDGFIEGCMSIEGNTRDVCESATDA
jgi:hypothetical protein